MERRAGVKISSLKKILASALVLLGIVLISFPYLEEAFSRYWQKRLLSEWNKNLKQIEVVPIETEDESLLSPGGEILGVLKINSINLSLPVLSGLNQANLKVGVSWLEDSAPVESDKGNTILAGHRGRSYSRLLNRLGEVNTGDKVVVETKNGVFAFRVFNKKIVPPKDTSLLLPTKDKVLTIVTCHPAIKPTHRLIIQAEPEKEGG
ncbi:MAG: class D sortase [Clostridia bacterium]|nr:class D sortase [Clostridia bacterium]